MHERIINDHPEKCLRDEKNPCYKQLMFQKVTLMVNFIAEVMR